MGASGRWAGSPWPLVPVPWRTGPGHRFDLPGMHQPAGRNPYGGREISTLPASPACAGPVSGRLASSASIAATRARITTPIGEYGGDSPRLIARSRLTSRSSAAVARAASGVAHRPAGPRRPARARRGCATQDRGRCGGTGGGRWPGDAVRGSRRGRRARLAYEPGRSGELTSGAHVMARPGRMRRAGRVRWCRAGIRPRRSQRPGAGRPRGRAR